MLKRLLRLPSRTKLINSHSFHATYFMIKIASNTFFNNRFAFVVSKQVAKSAVVRNKTRRMLRSILEQHITNLGGGKDILFIAKKQISKDNKNKAEEEFLNLVQKRIFA